MNDGTFEQKVDAIMDLLYEAYLKSLTTNNLMDAFLYNTQFLSTLREKFTDKNINVGIFVDRLERDENILHIEFGDGIGYKYKLSPIGVDFVSSGKSYVKIAEREKQKRDLEYNLLISQNKSNESTILTNENIRITNTNIQETNKNINSSNRVLKSIFLWTALISFGSLFVSAFNTYRELHKDTLSSQLHTSDSLLQVEKSEAAQLKKALDSMRHKPD